MFVTLCCVNIQNLHEAIREAIWVMGQYPMDGLYHAETNVLLRAAREYGGTLAGRTLEVVVDGAMCPSCQRILPKVGMELGNPTVIFIGPRGQTRTMRKGEWD